MSRYSIRPISNKSNRYAVVDAEINPGLGPVVVYRGTEKECRAWMGVVEAAHEAAEQDTAELDTAELEAFDGVPV